MGLRNPSPARRIPRQFGLSNVRFVNAIVVCCVRAFLATHLGVRGRVGSLVISDLDVIRRKVLARHKHSGRRTERLLWVSVLRMARVDVVWLVFVLVKWGLIRVAVGAPVVDERSWRSSWGRRVACQQLLVLVAFILCLLSLLHGIFPFFLLMSLRSG